MVSGALWSTVTLWSFVRWTFQWRHRLMVPFVGFTISSQLGRRYSVSLQRISVITASVTYCREPARPG